MREYIAKRMKKYNEENQLVRACTILEKLLINGYGMIGDKCLLDAKEIQIPFKFSTSFLEDMTMSDLSTDVEVNNALIYNITTFLEERNICNIGAVKIFNVTIDKDEMLAVSVFV